MESDGTIIRGFKIRQEVKMETTKFNHQTIEDAIPHRAPFLFIDEILEWTEKGIVCAYRFKGDEFFFQGHYPGSPIVPGVILCESAMQAGAIFLSKAFQNPAADGSKMPVVGRMNEVKFKNIVRPGNTIRLEVSLKEKMGTAWFMNAKILNEGKTVLTFEFACTETNRFSA